MYINLLDRHLQICRYVPHQLQVGRSAAPTRRPYGSSSGWKEVTGQIHCVFVILETGGGDQLSFFGTLVLDAQVWPWTVTQQGQVFGWMFQGVPSSAVQRCGAISAEASWERINMVTIHHRKIRNQYHSMIHHGGFHQQIWHDSPWWMPRFFRHQSSWGPLTRLVLPVVTVAWLILWGHIFWRIFDCEAVAVAEISALILRVIRSPKLGGSWLVDHRDHRNSYVCMYVCMYVYIYVYIYIYV